MRSDVQYAEHVEICRGTLSAHARLRGQDFKSKEQHLGVRIHFACEGAGEGREERRDSARGEGAGERG